MLFSLSKVAIRTGGTTTHARHAQAPVRSLHESRARQSIMMPAMSPLMTEGTVKRWKKKEGETFRAGDVLLQIESDIAMIDVEAELAGVITKILVAEGTTNVPVEKVIALCRELTSSQEQNRTQHRAPSPSTPRSPSMSRPISPRHSKHFKPPPTSSIHPMSEIHTMASVVADEIHSPALSTMLRSPVDKPVRAPCPQIQMNNTEDVQLDGATIRRMIVTKLSQSPKMAPDEFDELI